MWKKGFRGRGKENTRLAVGQPVLIETSYDTRLLNKAKHRPLMEAANEAAASLRPPQLAPTRESQAASSVYSQPDPRYSKAASSVYSQPSPNVPYEHWPPNGLGFSYPYDVSPVEESPNPYEMRGDSDVSDTDEPKSRFSWSTRGATPQTVFQHSPPPSPPPPLPAKYSTKPQGPRDPPQNFAESLFDKRLNHTPSIRSVATTASTIRKPVPTPSPQATITNVKRSQTLPMNNSSTPTQSKPSTPKPASVRSATPVSANKTLPLPPQLQDTESIICADPISKYSAQLDDLSLRRININRVIKDLTSLPDLNNPLAVDWSTRRANERKVKALQDELTEIGAQEHEIGMKLHRARKKAEREEGFDSGTTALWVRRVTNPV